MPGAHIKTKPTLRLARPCTRCEGTKRVIDTATRYPAVRWIDCPRCCMPAAQKKVH